MVVAPDLWQDEVFAFLDARLGRGGRRAAVSAAPRASSRAGGAGGQDFRKSSRSSLNFSACVTLNPCGAPPITS